MDQNLERFLRYIKIDTQSNDESLASPSEAKELDLTRLLQKELKEMGIENEIDEYGRLYAHLAGVEGLDAIGLNAHVDTATEISGKDVKPQLIENYDGGVIRLNDEYKMSPNEFDTLKGHEGDTLVVTSGDTLLGGDDKAGVAVIMSVLDYLTSHKEVKHHPLSILFTPDEEIGRGPEHFDAKKFGADYAYTIDGDYPDHIDIENFNAAHAEVTFYGVGIHPGEAKGKMVNAISLGEEFDRLLDPNARPEFTSGHEGFNHCCSFEGSAGKATLYYIIRNHDASLLEKQKEEMIKAKEILEKKYPTAKIELEIGDDYRNMKEIIDKDPRALEHAKAVFKKLGIEPKHLPVRGGTDGATFSFKGCPTPNLGTGSYNHHGRFEFLSVRDFNKMIEIVIELVKA
ncbi:MAG: peptidase T [Bacilli bacterium]|nr:peptidase T [Bacilli bacterium]